jgi:hypothetical protein
MAPQPSTPGMERPAIALDNGCSSIKIGFCGEEAPRALVPTHGLDEAAGVAPLCSGVVQDWEAMEIYWDHAFTHHLRINTEQCNVILTAHLWETKLNKERLAQSLFESFAVPGIYVSSPPVFELYAAGRENGVVLGCGGDCTYVVLLHEGLPDPRTLMRGSVAGAALTAHTARLLSLSSLAAAEAAKVAGGCVAAEGGAPADGPVSFTLPDGKTVTVSAEQRAAIAEPLFNPELLLTGDNGAGGESGAGGGCGAGGSFGANGRGGSNVGNGVRAALPGGGGSCGVSRLVSECIRARDRDGALESLIHGRDGTGSWYSSVVLAGGSSCFKGMEGRVNAELAVCGRQETVRTTREGEQEKRQGVKRTPQARQVNAELAAWQIGDGEWGVRRPWDRKNLVTGPGKQNKRREKQTPSGQRGQARDGGAGPPNDRRTKPSGRKKQNPGPGRTEHPVCLFRQNKTWPAQQESKALHPGRRLSKHPSHIISPLLLPFYR